MKDRSLVLLIAAFALTAAGFFGSTLYTEARSAAIDDHLAQVWARLHVDATPPWIAPAA